MLTEEQRNDLTRLLAEQTKNKAIINPASQLLEAWTGKKMPRAVDNSEEINTMLSMDDQERKTQQSEAYLKSMENNAQHQKNMENIALRKLNDNPYAEAKLEQVKMSTHNNVMNKMSGDTVLKNLATAQNRLSNGLSIVQNFISSGKNITLPQFNDLQQGVALAATGGGQTTGGERESRYINSVYQKAQELGRKLTNQPEGISPNDPLLQQVLAEAHEINSNVASLAKKRIDSLSSGYKGFYTKNPDLMIDYQDRINSLYNQFGSFAVNAGSNNTNTTQIKTTADGRKFKKVQGGWEEIN